MGQPCFLVEAFPRNSSPLSCHGALQCKHILCPIYNYSHFYENFFHPCLQFSSDPTSGVGEVSALAAFCLQKSSYLHVRACESEGSSNNPGVWELTGFPLTQGCCRGNPDSFCSESSVWGAWQLFGMVLLKLRSGSQSSQKGQKQQGLSLNSGNKRWCEDSTKSVCKKAGKSVLWNRVSSWPSRKFTDLPLLALPMSIESP